MSGPKKKISKRSKNPGVLEALGISLKFAGESGALRVVASDKRVQMINDHNAARPSSTPHKAIVDVKVTRSHDFHRACRHGLVVDVEFMVREFPETLNDPSVSSEDGIGTGGTCLHYAVLGNQADVVEYLLNHGALHTLKTERGVSPLHLACSKGYFDCARILIEKGASMGDKDSFGNSSFSILSTHSGDRAISTARKEILSYYNRRKHTGQAMLGDSSRNLLELTDKILYRKSN